MTRLKTPCSLLLILVLLGLPVPASAYSVLTHEQLIDLAWNDCIRPFPLSRYPHTSEAALGQAHAYAYGGSAIQDMGYYPFGKEFFSNLTHYVRSGDFVASLFHNARNVDELAFAVGALSHYLGDNIGHSECINPATAVEFPKLAKKYGEFVTYDQAPHAHVRAEFAFDVNQLSHHRLASATYLRHVGFKVPRRLVERAFYETYGLYLREVLGPEIPAIRSYRTAVRSFIPQFAHAETVIHGKHFPPDVEDEAFQQFQYQVDHADFQKHWAGRKHAGFLPHVLAIVIVIVPKIGPVSDLAIRGPSQQPEEWYVRSVNDTMKAFHQELADLRTHTDSPLSLPNRDLDTGQLIQPGSYPLTDKTYAKLLQHLTADPVRQVPEGLRRDILAFYSDSEAPIVTKKNHKAWKRVQQELAKLRELPSAQSSPGSASASTR